jgi:hypothetical protein
VSCVDLKSLSVPGTTITAADMTRTRSPYPQLAKYKRTGSIKDAANLVCKAP